jgi:tetratricopeptide (TPR) repeat protein
LYLHVALDVRKAGGNGIAILHDGLLALPNDLWLLYLLSWMYHDQGQFARSADVLRACRAVRPDAPLLIGLLGTTLLAAGDIDGAERASQEAIRRQPTAQAHLELGSVYVEGKKWRQASDAFRSATEVETGNVLAWYMLGRVKLQLRDVSGCEAAFRRVVDLDQNHAGGHFFLGVALTGSRRWDEAEAAIRKAADLDRAC